MTGVEDTPFFGVLEADLRILSSEARKQESLAQQINSWLSHQDHPQVREAAERAALKLRAIIKEKQGIQALRTKDILHPFLLVCETRNHRLLGHALSSIQKLLANNAVSDDGRELVIKTLLQVEKSSDDLVKLKILQTALTLLQSAEHADQEESICKLLGLTFRMYAQSKHNPTVLSTASATIRQAVALVFDHAVLPRMSSTGAVGREHVALNLLKDLYAMLRGEAPAWVKAPVLSRGFVFDLTEFILLHRPEAFHQIGPFGEFLESKITPQFDSLLGQALDPEVDPGSLTECRHIMRCAGALLRRHQDILSSRTPGLLATFLAGAQPSRMVWQRIYSLQVLRFICLDHMLVYRLFTSFDLSIDLDLNAVHSLVKCMHDVIKGFMKIVNDYPDDDHFGILNHMYAQKASGKDPLPDVETCGPVIPYAEYAVAFLALECLLGLVGVVESLTDMVQTRDPDTCGPLQASASQEVRFPVCANLVDMMWRMMWASLSSLLSKCHHEALTIVLLKGFQWYTYSAGTLGVLTARDGFLNSLCEFALAPPEPPASPTNEVLSPSGDRSNRGHQPPNDTSVRAGGGAGSEGKDSMVLSAKNVQALRTLFNIAHRLNESLGRAWLPVMDVLTQLDSILANPHTTVLDLLQEGVKESRDQAAPSDLTILGTAANQLFECTSQMSTEAVVDLLSALSDVSLRELPAQASVGQFRLNALNRMVETLLYNLERLQDLWPIFLSHIMELFRSNNLQVRNSAIDALDKTLMGALAAKSTTPCNEEKNQQPGASISVIDSQKCESSPPAVPDAGLEHMMLVALESIFKEDGEADVRLGTLRVVLHVLQRRGEHLTRGWVPLLRLLEAVPTRDDPTAITQAFQSVELLCTDFLATVPRGLISKVLDVVSVFGQQTCLINVSLTAVGLLWTATDFLAKSWANVTSTETDRGMTRQTSGWLTSLSSPLTPKGNTQDAAGSPGGTHRETVGGADVGADVGRHDLSEELCLDLLIMVFKSLKTLSMERRPEVRNSAVRTLFLAIGSHASRFSLEAWQFCLWEVMFSLVKYTYEMSSTSSCEEAAAEELGKEKGKSVKMLVHHSRNTEQKQWDETLVMAINGLVKVLQRHLPVCVDQPGFEAGWTELMDVLGRVLELGRRTATIAATALIAGVLQMYGGTAVMTTTMWKKSLTALDVGVCAMACTETKVPLQARMELVSAISSLYQAQRPNFDLQDTRQYLRWLDQFARYPFGPDDVMGVQGILPQVQKGVLQGFSQMAPISIPEIWQELLQLLCDFLCPIRSYSEVLGTATPYNGVNSSSFKSTAFRSPSFSSPIGSMGASPDRPSETSPLVRSTSLKVPTGQAMSSLWMTKVLQQVLVLYRDHAPWQVRVRMLSTVVGAVKECLMMRYVYPGDDLWREAVPVFIAVMNAGLPALNIAVVHRYPVPDGTWECLSHAFEQFLLGDEVNPDKQQYANGEGGYWVENGGVRKVVESEQDEELQAAVLDTLTDSVLSACSSASTDMQRRLVSVVERGIGYTARPYRSQRFSHLCMRKLYVLCSRGSSAAGSNKCLLDVALLAMPLLMHRCIETLQGYVEHHSHVGVLLEGSETECQESSSPCSTSQVDDVVCALEVMTELQVTPSVTDTVVAEWPHLKGWVDWCRQYHHTGQAPLSRRSTRDSAPSTPTRAGTPLHSRQNSLAFRDMSVLGSSPGAHDSGRAEPRKECLHLAVMYNLLCEFIDCPYARIRVLVKDLMQLLGREVGLGEGVL